MHEASGMGQLVLGITVPGTTRATSDAEWHTDRKLQLEISERAGAPRYTLRLRDDAQGTATPIKPRLIGPTTVLMRGQPVEIEVVNKLKDPTAIHWHGIELEVTTTESPDGVVPTRGSLPQQRQARLLWLVWRPAPGHSFTTSARPKHNPRSP
jgi:FtsP/CotA-like multicopper oxidase with cupredoxin domain